MVFCILDTSEKTYKLIKYNNKHVIIQRWGFLKNSQLWYKYDDMNKEINTFTI